MLLSLRSLVAARWCTYLPLVHKPDFSAKLDIYTGCLSLVLVHELGFGAKEDMDADALSISFQSPTWRRRQSRSLSLVHVPTSKPQALSG